jgi:molybdate transport system substrate-binding protein
MTCKMYKLGFILLAPALLVTSACRPSPKSGLIIAAAANLTQVFQQLGPPFEQQTGIHPVFSFGSTAQLARQVENSAPFDVIAAADSQHIDELDRKGLLVPGSRAVYATGVLAVWIPPHSHATVTRVLDLASPTVSIIAVAKPELAPYGEATVATLQRLGIWDAVKSKIVYAENISMAKQFGTSNNADAVFTAYSLVLKESGRVIPVDERLHRPITQELGIVRRSQHSMEARRFVDFLLTGSGRQVLLSYGYH